MFAEKNSSKSSSRDLKSSVINGALFFRTKIQKLLFKVPKVFKNKITFEKPFRRIFPLDPWNANWTEFLEKSPLKSNKLSVEVRIKLELNFYQKPLPSKNFCEHLDSSFDNHAWKISLNFRWISDRSLQAFLKILIENNVHKKLSSGRVK